MRTVVKEQAQKGPSSQGFKFRSIERCLCKKLERTFTLFYLEIFAWKYKFSLKRGVLWGAEVEAAATEHGLYGGCKPRVSAQVRLAGSLPPQVLIGAHWSPQLLIEIPQRIVITLCAEALGKADHSKTVKALIKLFLIIALYLKRKMIKYSKRR